MPVPEAVTRDVCDRHQVVTKGINKHAMLSKRGSKSWLAAGRWETEQSCHCLTKLSMGECLWPSRGREGSNHERSTILAGLRRRLSMVTAKAYSACLMDRVSRVGEGHMQAAKRRAWVKREGERMEDERR
jgi:hypothetical protein